MRLFRSRSNQLTLSVVILGFLLLITSRKLLAQRSMPQQLVQQQIDGWNSHSAADLAAPYADSTTLYTFPDQVLARFCTRRELEEYYAKIFDANPSLHCDVANQMIQGNTVIVHEKTSGWINRPNFDSPVIYHIENDKIVSVHFVRR